MIADLLSVVMGTAGFLSTARIAAHRKIIIIAPAMEGSFAMFASRISTAVAIGAPKTAISLSVASALMTRTKRIGENAPSVVDTHARNVLLEKSVGAERRGFAWIVPTAFQAVKLVVECGCAEKGNAKRKRTETKKCLAPTVDKMDFWTVPS